MKKDKAFAIYGNGWNVGYEPFNHKSMMPYRHMSIYLGDSTFTPNKVKQLRKFIKALKKGLRRLEK